MCSSGFSSELSGHVALHLPWEAKTQLSGSVWFHFVSHEAETQSETNDKTNMFLMVFT